MKIPSIKAAKTMLKNAEILSPGPWVAHSFSTAENAKCIADKCNDMDSDVAYVMGLLHDIGRREGFKHILHLFDGYDYLVALGYDDAARICLTHSFPLSDINTFFGEFDCSREQFKFLESYLVSTTYDDYDRIIQLCDAISLPQGAVLMEKRFVDVAVRHGLPAFTVDKWQSFFRLKDYFDQKAGCNIYNILPDIVENTFV